MGALVVGILTCGCTLSPCTCRLQWRPVTDGRPMVYKCTVGVLHFCSCRSMSWLWAWLSGSGEGGKGLWQLACYICPATETSVTSGAGLGLQWEWWGEGSRERLRLLCGTCETSLGEICRASTATVLTIGFMSGEICLGFLQNMSLNHSCFCYMSVNNSLCFSSLFLADLTHLNFAGGIKLKWELCMVSK